MELKSIVICSYYAYECCQIEFYKEGYEVIADKHCSGGNAYMFDNNGNMSLVKIKEVA